MLKLVSNSKYERLHSEENLIDYVKFSNGAIELHEDYVVFYINWLPFKSFVHGRMSCVISLNDIEGMAYKGCGLLPSFFIIRLKGMTTNVFLPTNWFPWTNKDLNAELREIYRFMFEKWTLAWKNDKYRKVQTYAELKKQGVCPVCGEMIEKDTIFCDKCGSRVGESIDE